MHVKKVRQQQRSVCDPHFMQFLFPRCVVKAAINVRGMLAEKAYRVSLGEEQCLAIKHFQYTLHRVRPGPPGAAWLESAQRKEGVARPYLLCLCSLTETTNMSPDSCSLTNGFRHGGPMHSGRP